VTCLTGRGSELQRAYVSLLKLEKSVVKLSPEMGDPEEDSESEEDSEEDSESVSGSEREGHQVLPQVLFKSQNDLLLFNSPCQCEVSSLFLLVPGRLDQVENYAQ
jgi:hypothetical protein